MSNARYETHREFVQGSGELSPSEHIRLLRDSKTCFIPFLEDGAIVFECMDARHIPEIMASAEGLLAFKQLCVWIKDRAGMGSFYRSQHELVFVFKYGNGPHINNFGLGSRGRYRTNVWSYPAIRDKRRQK
ncbi:MAG: hypothetical protein FWF24_02700 [Alphaproteobacteria bacterium]|nr:hypothetical protein [Alphaproteobacteria bacterium]